MNNADLEGQSAIVTGGTRGIGAAISRALLEAGAEVVATFHQNQDAATHFEQSCLEAGVGKRLTLRQFDVADQAAVKQLFSEVQKLQILVNNSGIRKDGVLGMMPEQSWQRVLDVNLTGAFHMCKHATRAMMPARYGRIINITSPSGRIGLSGQANYSASKAGLVALTRSLAREVGSRGITVNCVSPGFVQTEMLEGMSGERLEGYRKEIPLQRFATPEEIAPAVLFLASKAASYVTGAVLEVTGGL